MQFVPVYCTVLCCEVAELLQPAPDKVILDDTLSGGNHSKALLKSNTRMMDIDRDPKALTTASARLRPHGDNFISAHANFRDAHTVLDGLGLTKVDNALMNLNISSPQLDRPT